MSCTQRIAMLVLGVLTALPLSGTACALMCESANTAASHSSSGTDCAASHPSSSGVQVRGVGAHECSTHDGAVRPATTAAKRAHLSVAPATLAVTAPRATIKAVPQSEHVLDYSAPPGTAPPTANPLVLRV